MSGVWDEYAEALRVLARAPAAVRERRTKIEKEAARTTASADESLRAAVAARQRLLHRVDQVDGLVHKVLTEHRVPPAGVSVRIPAPRTTAEALGLLDRVEWQLRADADQLAAARRLVPPPPPPAPPAPSRLPLVLALVGGVVVALAVVAYLLL